MKSTEKPKAPEPHKPEYQLTAEDKAAVKRVHARRNGLPEVPRATLATNRLAFEHDNQAVANTVMMDALGISGVDFFGGYLHQVLYVATTGQTPNAADINAMLAAIVGVQPRDEMEAMLAAQMVATHNLAMTFARRLNHTETIQQQDSAVNGLTKLTRTYTAQMAALKHYRTGGEQRVIVQRVDVREGGQAVVGEVVNSDRGGGRPEQNRGQAHAKQITDARGTAMLCDIEAEREAVPVASGAGPADMQDARRD